jgi:hypothetical protein
MENNTTKIIEPLTGTKRDFNFDFSFWSHDGFEIDETGYNVKKND